VSFAAWNRDVDGFVPPRAMTARVRAGLVNVAWSQNENEKGAPTLDCRERGVVELESRVHVLSFFNGPANDIEFSGEKEGAQRLTPSPLQ
jgi:hypothetical protein